MEFLDEELLITELNVIGSVVCEFQIELYSIVKQLLKLQHTTFAEPIQHSLVQIKK